jgi:hypothetical protein
MYVLCCSSTTFNTPVSPATVASVQESFGATHAGGKLVCHACAPSVTTSVFDGNTYTQSWAGLSFSFAWGAPASGTAATTAFSTRGLAALPLPVGDSPRATLMRVYRSTTTAGCVWERERYIANLLLVHRHKYTT